MSLTKEEFETLEDKACELRKLTVDTVKWASGGHIGGALSSVDILTLLYYKYMNIDVRNPEWEDRDRFVLSKGHIGVGYAPVLADKGFFDKEWLQTYTANWVCIWIKTKFPVWTLQPVLWDTDCLSLWVWL